MSTKILIDRQQNKIVWQIVASIMAIGMAGQAARGQATNSPAPDSSGSTNVTQLGNTVVVGKKLDVARDNIIPNLGATAHSFDEQQIQAVAQGENAPFTQVLLRAPGVVQDNEASGALHVRGEHANLQYRINDVLLPEGISGFGLELDPRFVDSMQLITGSLPAAYGIRTAGVVDIHTKSGFENGGAASIYGGSYDTIRPSFEYGGTQGKWNFFVDGSYDHNALGIENPTPTHNAIHDKTDQFKTFLYGSYIIDDTSRLSLMGSASYSDFQIPNTPNLQTNSANFSAPGGAPWSSGGGIPTTFNSADVNERQNEQNYYAVAAYQKSLDNFNLQASVFGRVSSVHFRPDQVGDLFFDGVASDVQRRLYSGGIQADASYELNDKHTIRGGVLVMDESVSAHSTTTVFPVDPDTGNPTGGPFSITDRNVLHGIFAGIYLQDEWKIFPRVTINFGGRFDEFYSSFDKENQPSPRVNLIYTPTDSTTLHAGYARYFTPPPVESVSSGTISEFDGTSNSTGNDQNRSVKAERANYFDAGISQKIGKHLQVGMDGYYKKAHEQLDDGLFGQTLILSAFNYSEGRIYGVEFPISYNLGGFDAYANLSYSVAKGKNWSSSQFLFGPSGAGTDLSYVHNHWIYLDHDQTVSGSFGASYTWKHPWGGTRLLVDALYGSGLRTDAPNAMGQNVPNGGTVPAYYSVNLGAEESFKLSGKQMLKARLDVVNVTDNIYELRDGVGVGVNAASYGERLGFFGSLSYVF
ncbi:MAG TPA: TonB-dependent receptor [Verrucomicrobiae bacterium]|jgi:outer membrane receptor protein involved in Fe transport|nr:TonB-dependent receptor [Verrucomicrobiae bacterium]